ncbi:hypothetical protein Cyast_0325 [Cyanobacterium stanieri PCC 7202]|uniref:Nucleic acid binding OB-fold tRNA/helicase-type n=1 Tax=Cyanobacterium stanieri (strain ATCC 29140 / PCC 7202) TaxID=292563 RepID=K9YIT2_CYASC|nr:hypothetical protein Cyast_0325 [Cyanobacterium stanieri PCC 7202]
MNRFFGSWRSILMAIALTTTGCGYLIHGGFAGENQVTIEEIKTSADSENKSVKIEGNVTQVIPLVNGYAFEIEDNTGSIWVMTTGEKPEVGQKISTQATVNREEIMIAEQDMSSFYLQEIVEEEDISEEEIDDDTVEFDEDTPTPETDG